jgi:hypothetical protein
VRNKRLQKSCAATLIFSYLFFLLFFFRIRECTRNISTEFNNVSRTPLTIRKYLYFMPLELLISGKRCRILSKNGLTENFSPTKMDRL